MHSHNPYFNRWFSAISLKDIDTQKIDGVTILILIDGFLQLGENLKVKNFKLRHNPYFNRWFSAMGETRILQQTN